jgi:hypothetical protein
VYANSTAANGKNTAQAQAQALDLAVATQLGQLPLATASAGTVIAYKNGVPETFNNLGPILVDRAQPIGANRFFLGATATQYVFTYIDSESLKSLPFFYSKSAKNPDGSTTYVSENIKSSFVVNQLVAVATLGLTSHAEASFIIPFTRVSTGSNVPSSIEYVVDANGNRLFTAPGPTQSASGTASGVGDIEISGKYAIFVGERSAVSTGAILRTPSGVAENFLGSGAWGFNPYLVYTYLSHVSPHARIGYQWNSSTYLNPNIDPATSKSKGNLSLPGGLAYDIGADWAISKRFTAAGDLMGNQYLNTQRIVVSNTLNIPGVPEGTKTTTNAPASYSITDISTGLKWNPGSTFVVSINLLTQINNDGLHARPAPLIGLSYKF